MAEISTVDKIQRLSRIQELLDEGKTDSEISKDLDIPIITVRKNIKKLEEISVAEIAPAERGKRRAELYVELQEAAEEARRLFEENSKGDKAQNARGYFKSWLETIEMRMRLFGLEVTNKSVSNLTQINQYMNPVQPDRLPTEAADKIAATLKKVHEDKVNK